MTGRAKGRARGRARGRTPPPQGAGPRRRPSGTVEPGEPTSQQDSVGAGPGVYQGRGATVAQPQIPLPPTHVPEQRQRDIQQQQVAQQMGNITLEPAVVPAPAQVSPASSPVTPAVTPASSPVTPAVTPASGGGRGRGAVEPGTNPEHITDKRGTSGHRIQVVSNYFSIKNRPNCALYQYNVTFNPQLESKKLRVALLYSYADIGQTKTFDGATLYLPTRLPDKVTKFTKQTKQNETIEIIITRTNDMSVNSPTSIQLFNIILRR